MWANHLSLLSISGVPFRVQFFHIPGHTPDSLAWFDFDENHLYVGDMFYERHRRVSIPELPDDGESPVAAQGAIIIPEEGGNLIELMSSLECILSFVLHRNQELRRQFLARLVRIPRVQVGCGHLTHSGDAESMIREVQTFFEGIIAGSISASESKEQRGILCDLWVEPSEANYSLFAPRHLVQEARKHYYLSGLDSLGDSFANIQQL